MSENESQKNVFVDSETFSSGARDDNVLGYFLFGSLGRGPHAVLGEEETLRSL
jgi:hypothetical protein